MTDAAPRRFSGSRLKAARKAAKLSRFELSRLLNFRVGPQQISRYEKGKTVPPFNVAINLAECLCLKLEDLTDA